MADRYDNFSIFMAEVTEKSKNRIIINGDIWGYIIAILTQGGWVVFLALCALLGLGPIAFGAAVLGSSTTPFGVILALVCAGGSGVALWAMYKKRELPLAVKEIGNKYKSRHSSANSHYEIDRLLEQASDDLYRKVTR